MSIGVMLFLWVALPIKQFVPYPYNFFGSLFFVVGLILAKVGSDKFERVGTNIETFKKPDILVTDGLFSISRNPMYLGFISALTGIALMLGNLSSFAVVIIFFVVTNGWYIPFEEDAMEYKFGEQYINYKKSTRRWL